MAKKSPLADLLAAPYALGHRLATEANTERAIKREVTESLSDEAIEAAMARFAAELA